ncbi:hypothetical protein [Elizabethkingia ursingii]|nr:hypothetical protein [Elizabethkingia ursingii]
MISQSVPEERYLNQEAKNHSDKKLKTLDSYWKGTFYLHIC